MDKTNSAYKTIGEVAKILDLNYTNMLQESYILDCEGKVIARFENIKSYNLSKG